MSAGDLGSLTGGAAVVWIVASLLSLIHIPNVSRLWRATFASALAAGGAALVATSFGGMTVPEATWSYFVPAFPYALLCATCAVALAPNKEQWDGWMRVRIVITALVVVLIGGSLLGEYGFNGTRWGPSESSYTGPGNHEGWLFWPVFFFIPGGAWWVISGLVGWMYRGFRK